MESAEGQASHCSGCGMGRSRGVFLASHSSVTRDREGARPRNPAVEVAACG